MQLIGLMVRPKQTWYSAATPVVQKKYAKIYLVGLCTSYIYHHSVTRSDCCPQTLFAGYRGREADFMPSTWRLQATKWHTNAADRVQSAQTVTNAFPMVAAADGSQGWACGRFASEFCPPTQTGKTCVVSGDCKVCKSLPGSTVHIVWTPPQ